MSKRAVILAGGKGKRLHPYTVVFPKPLMPIGDYPILEVVIRQLAYYGFDHITLAVNHQADIIKSYFNSGEKWGVCIDYSVERTPLGTIGPLRLINDLPAHFLVMNGDILTDFDYGKLFEFHLQDQDILTVAYYQRKQCADYGVLEIDDSGILRGFREKPIVKFNVSMGIYAVSREVLDFIPEQQVYGFDQLMLDLIKADKPAGIKKFDGYWLDIGRPDDYTKAVDEFELLRDKFIKCRPFYSPKLKNLSAVV